MAPSPRASSSLLGRPLGRVVQTVKGLGFWTAVVIPFLYLPLFTVQPLIEAYPMLLFTIITINVIALLIGHDYEPSVTRSNSTEPRTPTPR